jgi:hypothetical protein
MATRLELPVLLFRSSKPHFRFRRFGLKSLDSLNQQIHLEKKTHLNLGQCSKTFYGCNLRVFEIRYSVIPDRPFQSSVWFVNKAGAYMVR